MDKKVLIATYYWPPSGGSGVQRWVKFCKYLPEFGIEPVVLTVSNPTYTDLDPTLEQEVPGSLKVFKTKSLEPYRLYAALTGKDTAEAVHPTTSLKHHSDWTSAAASWVRANIFIPDGRAGWLLTARDKALEIVEEHGIDTVITTGPPHSAHFIGTYLKEREQIRWIADFRDPWTEVFYNQNLPRTALARNIDLSMEHAVLKQADEVLVISDQMGKVQQRVLNRDYRVITNGFDHEDFQKQPATNQNDAFTIRHVGSLPEASVPHGWFEAIARISQSVKFNVEFIGNVHAQVHELVEKFGLQEQVFVKGYIPHAEAISAMQTADLLLLVIPDAEDNELILTGKLFEYLGSGTPIMLVGPVEGDAASIIDSLSAGSAFEHADVEKMGQFLTGAVAGTETEKTTLATGSLKKHPYSRYRITETLAEVIKS